VRTPPCGPPRNRRKAGNYNSVVWKLQFPNNFRLDEAGIEKIKAFFNARIGGIYET
jgi:hypothetical protein